MVSRIPKGFGSVKSSKEAEKTGKDGARPLKIPEPKKVISPAIPVPKQKEVVDLSEGVNKKQKTKDVPYSLALNI